MIWCHQLGPVIAVQLYLFFSKVNRFFEGPNMVKLMKLCTRARSGDLHVIWVSELGGAKCPSKPYTTAQSSTAHFICNKPV